MREIWRELESRVFGSVIGSVSLVKFSFNGVVQLIMRGTLRWVAIFELKTVSLGEVKGTKNSRPFSASI
jgi:hypothetical protein